MILITDYPPADGFPPYEGVGYLVFTLLCGCAIGWLISVLLKRFNVWYTFGASALLAFLCIDQIGDSSWFILLQGAEPDVGAHISYFLGPAALTVFGFGLYRWRKAKKAQTVFCPPTA